MRSSDTFNLIKDTGIVAILRGIDLTKSMFIIEALAKAGIKAIEVTFNTPNADKIIYNAINEFKNDIVIGAGTVISGSTAVRAIEIGAEFILAPNMDFEVISTVKKYGKIMIPGAFTASEILKCYEHGADIVKIFPVSSVGPKYIKDLRGPYNYINMMPVGGVDVNNIKEFIKAGSIAAGVGSSLLKKDLLESNDYKGIEALAKIFLKEIADGKN